MAGGTMTPVTPGAGTGTTLEFARPLPATYLSLHRYAEVMGINPIHFSGGSHSVVFSQATCDQVWPWHSWQSDKQASWEDLAWAIKDAEQTISQFLNYNLVPAWSINEEHEYPKYLRRYFTNTINLNGQRASVNVQKGRLIAGGQRATTLIHAGVIIVFTDEDGDGYEETAVITATIPGGVTVDDWRQVKVYFQGTNADPRWEIRPIKNVTVNASTIVIETKSWLFIDPDLRAALPGADGFEPVDVDDTTGLVASVDVYLEYNDTTAVGSQFVWEKFPIGDCTICSGVGCDECTNTTQDGCLKIRNGKIGKVAPIPATYDGGWTSDALTVARSPDKVNLWYYSGNIGYDYESGLSNDPLDYWLAQAIAWLATARLDREVCTCVSDNFDRLQTDMSFSSQQGNFLTIAEDIQAAPFGARVGEWMAYQKVKHVKKYITVAVM